MKLSQIGELSLLDEIQKRFGKYSSRILVGIGDDAALIKASSENILVTTDMMVEGIHFNLGFATPYQIGFKLVSVNVSDIFAMGGKPKFLLLNVAMNKSTDKTVFDGFFDGVGQAMSLYGLSLVGGDISASHKGISVSATIIGYAKKYVTRSGAKRGDRIYVTGNLGDSACGLALLKKIKRPIPLENTATPPLTPPTSGGECFKVPSLLRGEGQGEGEGLDSKFRTLFSKCGLSWGDIEPLLRRHLMPVARNPIEFVGNATSMIDISDGLLIDLSRICDESKVGARVCTKKIPLSCELTNVALCLNIAPTKLALSGGEDYELLFTAPANKKIKAKCIGEIVKSQRVLVDCSGIEKQFSAEGYQHFGIQR
jgi:thiamine-monophosphate kinase